jgi:hypothetical protein
MTANELAQLIEDVHPRGFVKDAANMLRQQEAALLAEQKHNEMLMAEIEALKKEAALQRLSDFTQEADNEPVAIRYDFDGYGYQYMDSGSGSDWQTRVEGEFLYTHPMRELRGYEIRTVIDEHWEKTSNVNLFDFARAILKKASEK